MDQSFAPSAGDASNDNPGMRPWLVFLAPFVVYMLLNSLEPARPVESDKTAPLAEGKSEPEGAFTLGIDYRYYPLIYTLKIAITGVVMLGLARDYARLPWRVSPLALLVGAVGVVLWIVITDLRLESKLLGPLGLGKFVASGTRAAYNPLVELADRPALAYGFLAIRFLGLALVVPIIEEFFLRGFLMRYLTDQRWWDVAFSAVSFTAIAVTTAAAMAMHPAELVAMLVWFSLVTWLMLRSGNLTDCVVAHGVTNLLLGIYVVASGSWYFL